MDKALLSLPPATSTLPRRKALLCIHSMSEERLEAALKRSESALSRIRRALAASDQERERDHRLRDEVTNIMGELDAIIAEAKS